MENEERIVRYTLAELLCKNARGESKTDWARLDAMTEEELEASIDWEDEGEFDLSQGYAHRFPAVVCATTVGLDDPILSWFKARGDDPLTQIRFALRDYVDTQHYKLAAEPRRQQRTAR